MKLKPVSEMVKNAHINGLEKAQNSKEITDDRTVLSYGYHSTLVGEEITQDRTQTLKAIEGIIEGEMKPLIKSIAYTKENGEATIHNQALTDLQTKLKELFS